MGPTPWLDDGGTALAELRPFERAVGPWLPLGAVALDRGASEGEPVTVPFNVVGLAVVVDVVSLAVAVVVEVDVVSLVAVVVELDVVSLVDAVVAGVDVLSLVDAVVVEVDDDRGWVGVALTSADASFGTETESEAAGDVGVVDTVVLTDATLATVAETGSDCDDAETDTPEIPSARASTGPASMRASAATHMYALFLLISPATANSQAIR
jgi:hypothetical protein